MHRLVVSTLVLIVLPALARADAHPAWGSLNLSIGDLVVGNQDLGVVAGEFSVAKELGSVTLRGEYEYLSLDQHPYPSPPVPLGGLGHRVAAAVRWDWWRVEGEDPAYLVRFGFEGGVGQSMIRWSHDRGTLLRPDLSFGVSTTVAFRLGRSHYLGSDLGLRVLLMPSAVAPSVGNPTELACVACSSAKGPIDWGLLFSWGVTYGR